MKKIIKRIVITLIIVGILVGGVYGAYRYNRSNKTAKVVEASMYAMDSYYGDNITSYGTVESDSAQAVFLNKDQKIKEIKVKEGDEVKKGDVLLTIESTKADLTGKSLQVRQAQNNYNIAATKLKRLEKTKPALNKDDYGRIEKKSKKTFVSKIEYFATSATPGYSTGDRFAVAQYDKDDKLLSIVYYDNHAVDVEEKDFTGPKDLGREDTSLYTVKKTEEEYTWTSKILYYKNDIELVGEDVFDEDGNAKSLYDFGEGLSADELAEEIILGTADLAKQELALKKMKLELKQMQDSAGTGEIVATVDGKVTKLQDQNNINYNSSFMTITGTNEFYIEGSIGEFYLDTVHVGDTVSVSSWENGASADATIISVSDVPTDSDGGWYDGNGNSSNYGFRASFDVNSGIELGSAVDISITPAESTNGIYLYSAMVRKDKGGYYIMIMDEETGRLKKQNVEIGKKLWGYYTEIKSDFSMDCKIAFPYGNGAIEGAACEVVEYLE